jgi:hypothetical protein
MAMEVTLGAPCGTVKTMSVLLMTTRNVTTVDLLHITFGRPSLVVTMCRRNGPVAIAFVALGNPMAILRHHTRSTTQVANKMCSTQNCASDIFGEPNIAEFVFSFVRVGSVSFKFFALSSTTEDHFFIDNCFNGLYVNVCHRFRSMMMSMAVSMTVSMAMSVTMPMAVSMTVSMMMMV